jgi:hypothetical protein
MQFYSTEALMSERVVNERRVEQGCQIFLGTAYQSGKICSKFTNIIPTGHKIYQYYPFQGHPKYIHIGIFVMQIYHQGPML